MCFGCDTYAPTKLCVECFERFCGECTEFSPSCGNCSGTLCESCGKESCIACEKRMCRNCEIECCTDTICFGCMHSCSQCGFLDCGCDLHFCTVCGETVCEDCNHLQQHWEIVLLPLAWLNCSPTVLHTIRQIMLHQFEETYFESLDHPTNY